MRLTKQPPNKHGDRKGHQLLYSKPHLYDVAFSYRKVKVECDFLEQCFRDHAGRGPSGFLELAAGPASHTREFARRGVAAAAVDLSAEMAVYAKRQAGRDGLTIDYQIGDMTSFHIEEKYDLGACLTCSVSYLLTNKQVYEHLDTVSRALRPEGLYVLEMEHPKSIFGLDGCTESEWEIETPEGRVRAVWNSRDDALDPVTQQMQVEARLEHIVKGDVVESVNENAAMRIFTATEMLALLDASGRFEVVNVYGGFSQACALDSDKAWRMIYVLKKRAGGT